MSLLATETNGVQPVGAQSAATVSQEEDGFRVYIGNLPFTITEEHLREFISKAGGEILKVILPMRYKRPAGFAFVHFKTEDAAKNAVEQLNESELGEREVSLEIARSREEQGERREAAVAKREATRIARKEAGETDSAALAVDGEAKPKKKRSSKKREPRRRLPEEGEEAAEGAEGVEANGAVSEDPEKRKRKPRARKPREPAESRIDGGDGEEVERKPRERRERKPRLESTGEQSENTVFVANLPFNVDDDALAAIFTNLSIRVRSAKVVQGLRRTRGGRPFRASRGFGFVEIEDSMQQKEAVEKVEGSLIGDRKISAKIANEMKAVEIQEAVEVAAEAPVAA